MEEDIKEDTDVIKLQCRYALQGLSTTTQLQKSKNMPRKKKTEQDENKMPRVHKDLEGFDIKINAFGEIVSTLEIEKINEFLNKNVNDKKLRHIKKNTEKDEDAQENS